jgi:hypothetical protein
MEKSQGIVIALMLLGLVCVASSLSPSQVHLI